MPNEYEGKILYVEWWVNGVKVSTNNVTVSKGDNVEARVVFEIYKEGTYKIGFQVHGPGREYVETEPTKLEPLPYGQAYVVTFSWKEHEEGPATYSYTAKLITDGAVIHYITGEYRIGVPTPPPEEVQPAPPPRVEAPLPVPLPVIAGIVAGVTALAVALVLIRK